MEGLFIVRCDQWDLYDYLRRRYTDVPEMTVILDRRLRERRVEGLFIARDRRRVERRMAPAASWEALGYIILAIPHAPPSLRASSQPRLESTPDPALWTASPSRLPADV